MDIQAQKITLNPTLERKTTLSPGLQRKTTLNPKLERGAALNPNLAAKAVQPNEDTKLRQACKDMESVFMGQLLKSMRSTVNKTDLFGSDKEEGMFQDMMDDEIAKRASDQKGVGIADMLYNQLSRLEKKPAELEKPLKLEASIVEK